MVRKLLVFGNSQLLASLAALLRVSPLLCVTEQRNNQELVVQDSLHPDVILVDAEQVTPEQFSALIEICPTLLSVDPNTHQITVLSSPHQSQSMSETARVIGLLSLILSQSA